MIKVFFIRVFIPTTIELALAILYLRVRLSDDIAQAVVLCFVAYLMFMFIGLILSAFGHYIISPIFDGNDKNDFINVLYIVYGLFVLISANDDMNILYIAFMLLNVLVIAYCRYVKKR